MKLSSLFLHTLKEDPREAEVISHKLMLRAAMIKKLASGIYSYLPYGLKALRKVENIIREEMDAAGAQEVLMPAVQPAEIWKESGRWEFYGKELLRFTDRKGGEFAMGPTHEEVITTIVRDEIRSYRDLPINLYQIQTKFRDEIRPRFGIMRAREFIMKDAYSFDTDDEGAGRSYDAMFRAYERIFTRCGLKFKAVEADSGPIGGNYSHEFMVLASTGEDVILSCSSCSYAANLEKAEIAAPVSPALRDAPEGRPEKVHTPDARTIEEVCEFLGVTPQDLVKTLIYITDRGVVAALVRGDHEVNEAKLRRAAGCETLELADEAVIEKYTGAPRGFAGPVGLEVLAIADFGLLESGPFVTGANEQDYHLKNVWLSRDAKIDVIADIRNAQEGDPCPRCGTGMLEAIRGIEVGHIFKLGTKYSQAMNAMFLDESGEHRPIIMGCYGIGVGRVLAAAIEQYSDEHGIVLPVPLAPYQVLVLPVSVNEEEVVSISSKLYEELKARGVDALIDDRDARPGVKFMDADLIGVPYRITVGMRGLKEGVVEIKERASGAVEKVKIGEAVDYCLSKLENTGNDY
ncbi:MAG TPA: proline--tRNA ligase [Deltaproteobacteria bacterium]|jgi:prolyl-tRNA synthetase|nr:proline--tRNA ligase [Deltaproteobacteria bacterium]HNU74736.1 proline--tRNA ligase [Deltaproteobacteria bacterium]HOD69421.1 proline--tRNA ligase [Deltaproteobacteria bacterium]HOE71280.1 proline--tRNA ligase [Deltaproteobacteria bacterium]HON60349.1 proline--tRNA ligase [Deltaproteobacteria bacterium]